MKRIEHLNHARFLTFSCYRNLPLLGNLLIRDLFTQCLSDSRDRLGFRLHAWATMPDHVHLIVRPRDESQTVKAILRGLKQSVSRRVLARWREIDAPILERIEDRHGTARFWQRGGGYDRNLFSREEIDEKVGCMHANPVRAELVGSPKDWVWSSSRWWAGQREEGVVAMYRLE
ncbi:MAG: transposase [Planctomycetota bacterium]